MPKLSDFFTTVVLASQSVARKKLLEELGFRVTVRPTHADESHQESEPAKVVHLLALRKMEGYRALYPQYEGPVLTCDTLVSCEGSLLGKPYDRKEAEAHLTLLSNREQRVHSGWALWFNDTLYDGFDEAIVLFKKLDEKRINDYLNLEEWRGAAGSYRIQERGKELVERVQGDIATVIGLPILQISEILASNCARL